MNEEIADIRKAREVEVQSAKLGDLVSRLDGYRIRGAVLGIASFIFAAAIPHPTIVLAASVFGALAMSVAVFTGVLEAFAMWLDCRLPRE